MRRPYVAPVLVVLKSVNVVGAVTNEMRIATSAEGWCESIRMGPPESGNGTRVALELNPPQKSC